MPTEKITAITIAQTEITVFQPAILLMMQEAPIPSITPKVPPIIPITMDSTKNCRLPLVSLNDDEKTSLAKHLGLADNALMQKLPLDLGKELEDD